MLATDGQQPASDRKLVGQRQASKFLEASGEVQRRWKTACPQYRGPAAGLYEIKLLVEVDPVRYTHALIEIDKIDAASQQDVLAVVDDLRCAAFTGDGVRGRASAQKAAGLEKFYLESSRAESGGSRESCKSAANDNRSGHNGLDRLGDGRIAKLQ